PPAVNKKHWPDWPDVWSHICYCLMQGRSTRLGYRPVIDRSKVGAMKRRARYSSSRRPSAGLRVHQGPWNHPEHKAIPVERPEEPVAAAKAPGRIRRFIQRHDRLSLAAASAGVAF